MEKIDTLAKKIGDCTDRLIYILGGGGLLLSVALCASNILSWWFLGRRIAISDEIALIGLVWASYVGMGLLFRNNGHCVMDFVVKILPPRWQVVLRIFTDLCILVIAGVAVYYSWALAVKSFTKKLVLTKIPYFYCDICVTVGYGHLLLLVIVDMIRNIYKLTHWDTAGEEGTV
ncbi:MAG: TRAP transporter small permease [Lawsonibacter sp.]|nr:TRAP transporter small permease [Lawsonibacter sp.]